MNQRAKPCLNALAAYLASEDSTMITRERVDLAALAAQRAQQAAANPSAAGPAGGGRRGFPTTWPECVKAPRTTQPRLK